MPQLLQIFQMSLFVMTAMGLFTLGILILVKPVLILHRRWYLLIFVPLLLANLLALIEEIALSREGTFLDWRLGLVLVLDLGLTAAGYWLLRGWLVYGLTTDETVIALESWLQAQGWGLESQSAEKTTWWSGKQKARRLQVERGDQFLTFWLIAQGSEVRLQAETRKARHLLREAFKNIRHDERAYQIREHMTGILYLVLAVVLAVLGWIFFFEPRLILIE